MKIITNIEANNYLSKYNMRVLDDNRIDRVLNTEIDYSDAIYNENTEERYTFYLAQHIVGWLSENKTNGWKLLKFMDWSGIATSERFLLGGLFFPVEERKEHLYKYLEEIIHTDRLITDAYLFEYKEHKIHDYYENIRLSQVISYLLAYEQHASIVSLYDNKLRTIEIQDGVIVIGFNKEDSDATESFLKGLENTGNLEYLAWSLVFDNG